MLMCLLVQAVVKASKRAVVNKNYLRLLPLQNSLLLFFSFSCFKVGQHVSIKLYLRLDLDLSLLLDGSFRQILLVFNFLSHDCAIYIFALLVYLLILFTLHSSFLLHPGRWRFPCVYPWFVFYRHFHELIYQF